MGDILQEQDKNTFLDKGIKPFRVFSMVVLLCMVLLYMLFNPGFTRPTSVEAIRNWVDSYGFWGPLVYVALYTVRPLLLIPSLPFNLAAGILFTPVVGFICLLAGGMGSATLLFAGSRWGLGSSLLKLLGNKWGGKLNDYLTVPGKNFRRLLWLRLVPIFAYDPVSIVCGCTGLDYKIFAGASILGMLPGAFAYCFLGESLNSRAQLPLAALLLALAFGVPVLIWYFKAGANGFKE